MMTLCPLIFAVSIAKQHATTSPQQASENSNIAVLTQTTSPAVAISTYAAYFLLQYRAAQTPANLIFVPPTNVPASQVPCKPPANSGLKLNVDEIVNMVARVTGMRAIFINGHGQVIATLCKPLKEYFKAREIEAMTTIFHSLHWASQLQLPITEVETNSMAINQTSSKLSTFIDIIVEVVSLLSFFSRVVVSHVRRDANLAAHDLAKHVLGLDNNLI
uniref:RNase H type-1 domain-containing protein n=1 Tax=Cannabis sativa TaxID=3483 RepID=A0A803P8F5_CANSA